MVRRNLPPEAEPWGRTVDSRLDSIEKRLAKIDQDTSNSLQMISGQLTQVISQQRQLSDTIERIKYTSEVRITPRTEDIPVGDAGSVTDLGSFTKPPWANYAMVTVGASYPTISGPTDTEDFVYSAIYAWDVSPRPSWMTNPLGSVSYGYDGISTFSGGLTIDMRTADSFWVQDELSWSVTVPRTISYNVFVSTVWVA